MASPLVFDIFAKDHNASRTFDNLGRSASRSSGHVSSFGKTFSRVGVGIAKAGVAAAAAVGVAGVALGVKFVNDARESNKVAAITVSQLKATKGAANLTAKQIGDLATAVSNKTGIDDEAIQTNENLLTSFRKIRDEAGKGNKIFSRTTALAQDMATVMGTDASSATMQLGKALNDPTKGLAKLARSGVTFTEQQKKQVTAMQKSGDMLGAQKVILREVGKEFGGAAEAAATPMMKLRVNLDNIGEAIGKKLIPFIDKGATALLGLINGFQSGTGAGGKIAVIFGRISDAAERAVPVIGQIVGWIRGSLIPTFVMLATGVGPQLKATFERIFGAIEAHKAIFPQLAGYIRAVAIVAIPVLVGALKVIGVAFQGLVFLFDKVVLPVMRATIRTILDLLGMIVHGAAKAFGWVPGIGPKLTKAASEFDAFRDKVNDALNGITDHKTILITSQAIISGHPGTTRAVAQGTANRVNNGGGPHSSGGGGGGNGFAAPSSAQGAPVMRLHPDDLRELARIVASPLSAAAGRADRLSRAG